MDATTLRVVRIVFEVINDRLYSILALWMTFVLACWAMYEPSYERLGMAAFFAVSVYIPSLRKDRKPNAVRTEDPQGQ